MPRRAGVGRSSPNAPSLVGWVHVLGPWGRFGFLLLPYRQALPTHRASSKSPLLAIATQRRLRSTYGRRAPELTHPSRATRAKRGAAGQPTRRAQRGRRGRQQQRLLRSPTCAASRRPHRHDHHPGSRGGIHPTSWVWCAFGAASKVRRCRCPVMPSLVFMK